MGKLIFWIVVVFAILFVLRLWNARQSAARGRAEPKEANTSGSSSEAMVRCDQCGVFLPRIESRTTATGFRCGDGGCTHRKPPSDAR